MLRYNEQLSESEKVLDSKTVVLYKAILNIDGLPCQSKIELYNMLKDQNMNTKFYEDIRSLKDKAYDNIKNDMLKLSEHSDLINEEYSSQLGTTVYDFRGKEFIALVRELRSDFSENTKNKMDCYSLISDKNTRTIEYGITYGYSDFDIDRVIHMSEKDAFSVDSRNSNESTQAPNRIATSSQLIESYFGISEINIATKDLGNGQYEAIRPDFIVSKDKITAAEISESKRLGIPIVLITENTITTSTNELGDSSMSSRTSDYSYGYDMYQEVRLEERLNNSHKYTEAEIQELFRIIRAEPQSITMGSTTKKNGEIPGFYKPGDLISKLTKSTTMSKKIPASNLDEGPADYTDSSPFLKPAGDLNEIKTKSTSPYLTPAGDLISTINIEDAITSISSMEIKQINNYLTQNNFDAEAKNEIMNSLSGDILAHYVIENIEDPRTLENMKLITNYNKWIEIDSKLITAETVNIIKANLNNQNYVNALGTYFQQRSITLRPTYNFLVTSPALSPYLCQDTQKFNDYIKETIDTDFAKVARTLEGISTSELSKYITISTINDISEESRIKLNEKFPGLIEEIINKTHYSAQDILNPSAETYKRFLDYDNNKLFFGNKTKAEYIADIYEFLIKDEALGSNERTNYKLRLKDYLEIPELREKLLKSETFIRCLEDEYLEQGKPKEFVKCLENNYVYEHIDKETYLYKKYAEAVMTGEVELNISRITNIVNEYRNSGERELSPEVRQNLINYLESENIVYEFQNRTGELNQEQLQRLIDYLSVTQLVNPFYLNPLAENYIYDAENNMTIYQNDYNEMFNYINKALLENNSAVDIEHYQSQIYNFTKYYCKLNNLDIDVKFYNEDTTEAGYSADGLIGFNTKFFTKIFEASNIYMDKIETIFHEVFHEMQNQEARLAENSYEFGEYAGGTVNKYSLIKSIEKILRAENEQYYKGNYQNILIEIDARYNSNILLLNYLKEVSPTTYTEFKEYIENTMAGDYSLYELNSNMFNEQEATLNRDMKLDKLMKVNATQYLQDYPLLNYIYNHDGSRKTIFELEEIKNNTNDQNVKNMVDYWIRNSKFSLNSLIDEYYALYSNPTMEHTAYVQDLGRKMVETVLLESNYLTDESFEIEIDQNFARLTYQHPNDIKTIEELENDFYKSYNKKIKKPFNKNNIKVILNQNSKVIIDYVSKNIDNPNIIQEMISQCDYETYRAILNSNIPKAKTIPYLCKNLKFFSQILDRNLYTNFDQICEEVLSNIDISQLNNYITIDQILKLTPEQRIKFEEKFPGVIQKITGT